MAEAKGQSGGPVRRRIVFTGTVQGVGFRYTACRVAGRLAVTGYVRNLANGQVEVVIEGPPGEMDRFVRLLADQMEGYVRGVEVAESAATGEFDGFDIRF